MSNEASPVLRVRYLAAIDEVDGAQWDACFAGSDPFVRHAFLTALECHGCVSRATGWTPSHVVVEDEYGQLLAAAPAYLKSHSWGEFVFDFSWARAAENAGIRYYPKLVCAVPFTPVTGPRLGVRDTPLAGVATEQLAAGLRSATTATGASSLHALFLAAHDRDVLLTHGCEERRDIQFHWHNAGYHSFSDFLATLKHDRRKKILRERRRVVDAGLRLQWQCGDALDEADWRSLYELYAHTYLERGQYPYLNLEFFLDYGRRAGTPLRIVSVYDDARRVAAAIFFTAGDTLYGRHWGAAAYYDSLHFETCYYQGVEYCIDHGLAHFDAGAQGGHKLVRGFAPQETYSAHWIADHRLAEAVAHSLEVERQLVDERQAALDHYLPYRKPEEHSAPVPLHNASLDVKQDEKPHPRRVHG